MQNLLKSAQWGYALFTISDIFTGRSGALQPVECALLPDSEIFIQNAFKFAVSQSGCLLILGPRAILRPIGVSWAEVSFYSGEQTNIYMNIGNQTAYWNKVANEKFFTHPLNFSVLGDFINKDSVILDFGCGYGRLIEVLNGYGYKNVVGFDTSIELINRGHRNGIENIFHISSAIDLPIECNSLDCILLFAVLTCIPDNKSQEELVATLFSKLKQGGVIYISDYYLQVDSTEMARYEYFNNDNDNYGVFSLPEGATFRHHTESWIKYLFRNFEVVHETLIEVKTMNQNRAEAFQLIVRK